MEISLSQIIWTIICFGLFALVLDRLLFRPVLKVMDERRAKIEGAAQRLAEARSQREAELEAARAEAEAQKLVAAEENSRRLEALRREREEELRELSRALEEANLREAEAAARFEDEAGAAFAGSIESLARAYARRLTEGGEP